MFDLITGFPVLFIYADVLGGIIISGGGGGRLEISLNNILEEFFIVF